MSFKPDYGIRLAEEGRTGSDLFFYDFRLYSLTVLGCGQFSTMVDMPYDGKIFALSLDFDQAFLRNLLSRAAPETARTILDELHDDPDSPRTIELPAAIAFGVRARLGKLQSVEKEQFIPLVAQELL